MQLSKFLFAAATTLVSAHATAQTSDGPYWSSYPIPAGVTSTRLLGSSFVAQTATDIHLYSSIHRNWTVVPVVSGATVTTTNDYSIVQDGTTFHAWSARTGTVQSLSAAAGATLSVGSTSSSWVCYVRDGSTFYGYSAFLGHWEPLVLQGSLQFSGIGSHALLVADDTEVHAFSAFFGTWVTESTVPGATCTAFRNGGIVTSTGPDTVKAFSCYSNTWASAAFPGAQTAVVAGYDGMALIYTGAGSDLLAFGVLHGTLSRLTMPGPVTISTGPNVAVLQYPSQTLGYAPGIDAFVALPHNSAVQLASGSFGCLAIVDDGTTATGFSGLTGHATPCPVPGSYSWYLGDTVGFGTDPNGIGIGYSALRDEWVPAPQNTFTTVRPTYEAMFLDTPAGSYAFSARQGTWSLLPGQLGAEVYQGAGALYGYTNPSSVDVFDPVLGRWSSIGTGPSPALSVWRLTGIAHDGTIAYGYCLFTNAWEAVPLQGTVVTFRAQDLVGYVETTTHYHMFSANGSLTNYARFPEFSRFVVRGAPLHHVQTGIPGSFVVGLFGFQDVEMAVPPYGIARVDPATAIPIAMGFIPASGMLDSQIMIPSGIDWKGIEFAMQDVVFTPQNNIILTNAQVPYIW